jgi:hypothetical protein
MAGGAASRNILALSARAGVQGPDTRYWQAALSVAIALALFVLSDDDFEPEIR